MRAMRRAPSFYCLHISSIYFSRLKELRLRAPGSCLCSNYMTLHLPLILICINKPDSTFQTPFDLKDVTYLFYVVDYALAVTS